MFIGQREVPHATGCRTPCGIAIGKRQRKLNHATGPDALFKAPLVDERPQLTTLFEGTLHHQLVLRKSFTCKDWPTEIQVCMRPRGIATEFAKIGDDVLDLFICERIFEPWHLRREPQRRTPMCGQSHPVAGSFSSHDPTVAQVRQGHRDSRTFWRPSAVASM